MSNIVASPIYRGSNVKARQHGAATQKIMMKVFPNTTIHVKNPARITVGESLRENV